MNRKLQMNVLVFSLAAAAASVGCGSAEELESNESATSLEVDDLDALEGETSVTLGTLEQPLIVSASSTRVRIPSSGSVRVDSLPVPANNEVPGSNFSYYTTASRSTGPFFGQFVNLRVNGVASTIRWCGAFSCTGRGKGFTDGTLPAPIDTALTSRSIRLATPRGDCARDAQMVVAFRVSTSTIPSSDCQAVRDQVPTL